MGTGGDMERDQENAGKARRRYNRLLFGTCGLAGLIYGIDMGLISAALPYIRETCGFSSAQLSSIVAAVLLGGIPGTFLGGPVCDRFGRRAGFQLTALVFAVAVPLICLSNGSFVLMFVGRLLQGAGCSLASIAAPLFIAESAESKDRGKGGGMIQLVLTVGLVVAALLGVAVSWCCGAPVPAAEATPDRMAAMTRAWQAIFWFSLLPTVFLFLGSLRLKETSRWLFLRGRVDEARTSLLMNNDAATAEAILADMRGNAADQSVADEPVSSLLQRKYVVPFVIVVLVIFFNQASGVNAVINYSVLLFNKAGLNGTEGNWADSALKTVNFLMTCVGVSLVDRLGRKPLLQIGTAGVVIGLVAAGLSYRLGLGGWFVASGFFVFMAGFAVGPGVCVWLAMSELCPTRIRAKAMMIGLFVGMAAAWGIAQAFIPWSEAMGEAGVFFTLAGVAVFYFLTVTFLLPETKGKSLEEIERHFADASAG